MVVPKNFFFKNFEALGYLGGTAKGWGRQPLELYASSSPRGGCLAARGERGCGRWSMLVTRSHGENTTFNR